jgi:hypothetical protein
MRRLLSVFLLGGIFSSPLLAQLEARAPASSNGRWACGQKLQIRGISNAGKINDSLYLRAQAGEKGLSELRKLGIPTILIFRGHDAGKIAWECKQVAALRIGFVHILVSGWALLRATIKSHNFSPCSAMMRSQIYLCTAASTMIAPGVFLATYDMAREKWPVLKSL